MTKTKRYYPRGPEGLEMVEDALGAYVLAIDFDALLESYSAVKAERDTLAQTFAETCAELGCAQDNEAALMAIHALRTERDELARALLERPHCKCPKFRNTMTGQERLPHLPVCPVALAEKIAKEWGDGC